MTDMISSTEAKNVLACDDATLNNHINNGTIRASRDGGQLTVSKEDVLRLTFDSDSDDGTLILASESEDFSIDLGDDIDDTAATMIGGGDSDDAHITFNDGDGLEMPDFDNEHTKELGISSETSDLSFTDSNTAVVTSVDETMIDETMVDQTVADLQTVDYGEDDNSNSNRSTGRISQRSSRSQALGPAYEEEPVHAMWPAFMGLTLLVMLFTIPYFCLALWPGDINPRTGERMLGSDDASIFTNLAGSIAGFSVEPSKSKFQATHKNETWVAMPKQTDNQAGTWRSEQWLDGASNTDERLESFTVNAVELVDGKPTKAIIITGNQQHTVAVTEVKKDIPGGSPTRGVYTIDLE